MFASVTTVCLEFQKNYSCSHQKSKDKNKEKYLQVVEARGTSKVKKLRESCFDKLDHVVFHWFISK